MSSTNISEFKLHFKFNNSIVVVLQVKVHIVTVWGKLIPALQLSSVHVSYYCNSMFAGTRIVL